MLPIATVSRTAPAESVVRQLRPVERIFLDLDDVCNDFTMTALRHVGCRIDSFAEYPHEVGFDIVAAAQTLLARQSGCPVVLSGPTFWGKITRSVWANCPPSPEYGYLLYRCARLVGKSNVCLLSKPTDDAECLAGKYEWIERFAPKWLKAQYLMGPVKAFCASPRALLIDDSDWNCSAFERAGGQAIRVPRPWNDWRLVDSFAHLERQFDLLASRQ